MTNILVPILAAASALGAGLVAGALFGFSTIVMRGLAALPPEQGAAAFKAIDLMVMRTLFVVVFVGTGLLSALALVLGITGWNRSDGPYLVAGGVLYLVGVIGITRAVHLPRNSALAAVDADSREGRELWTRVFPTWVRWNHVRTVIALAASAAFMVALRLT
ncbi:MAG TPA: anthrone oxygenase family protein [Actinopolymorphaceae bacterium]